MLKLSDDGNGYLRANGCRDGKVRTLYPHQEVLRAFVGPAPAGMEARHLNGDPKKNVLDNLAWGTRAQNIGDAKEHGTFPVGTRRPGAVLDEEKAREIAASTERADVLSARYGVSRGAIQTIRAGTNWEKATRDVRRIDYYQRGSRKLDAGQINAIAASSLPDRELARQYSVSPRLIFNIKRRGWFRETVVTGHGISPNPAPVAGQEPVVTGAAERGPVVEA